jgi:hypothetical protein
MSLPPPLSGDTPQRPVRQETAPSHGLRDRLDLGPYPPEPPPSRPENRFSGMPGKSGCQGYSHLKALSSAAGNWNWATGLVDDGQDCNPIGRTIAEIRWFERRILQSEHLLI